MTNEKKRRSSRHRALMLIGVAVALYAARFIAKEAGHGSHPGRGEQKVLGWLRAAGSIARDMLGMSTSTFLALERELKEHGGLKNGRGISAREKLAIFLYTCRFASSTRQTADVFGHSATSQGSAFKDVLRALINPTVYNAHVHLPCAEDGVPVRIVNDPGLNPFFKHVVGAIDGSHVPAHVPTEVRDRFWNRKGFTSFNVLAVCDFDMCFSYILSGWEGSASDSALWQRAKARKLKLPSGKMLLADAGFPCCARLLVPYRGVRYHLKEYSEGTRKPRNAKELYNRRHAGARSVVERVFGVLQARFKVLRVGCHYDLQTQADVFPALAVVHNFIRRHDPAATVDSEVLDNILARSGSEDQDDSAEDDDEGVAIRNCISQKMWKSYSTRPARRISSSQ